MLKLCVPADPLRLIAIDIDGTLLNPEFSISETDLATLRRAHAQGIEVILVTATPSPCRSLNNWDLISG